MQTPQAPIHSGFGPATTAAEIAAGHDLTGTIALVTGGNSGLGLQTVKTLAARGAKVVIGARDAAKSAHHLRNLENVSALTLDLADPASVAAFANEFRQRHDKLHLLFNNAGVFRLPQFQMDNRGLELQFGVNHLGHFQLTGLLWPALKNACGARVISLSSIGHRNARIDLEDPNFVKQTYDKQIAYARSKTATSLFAVHLDRIGAEQAIRSFAVHPGAILTDIFRYMSPEEKEAWRKRVTGFKTPEQGAATALWCALSPRLTGKGGVYCEDCDIAELVPDDFPATHGVRSFAIDAATAASLWRFSESVCFPNNAAPFQ
jgi:NAD(P)-dependent dehydrogenase (short-subunit alcohol dehydrogenase family)